MILQLLEKANNINSELIKNSIEAIIDDTDENYSSKIKKDEFNWSSVSNYYWKKI
jgi:hypothetical protein